MSFKTGVLGGRYQLDSPIAAGGVGEVWRAADLVLDRPVAVKVLRSQYAGQPQALARFRAEARHAGSVSHPAIAQIYDYGEEGDTRAPFLVMELVDGPSLADLLASGPLDPASSMDVLAQTAAGLQAAHAAGLVHRDVKPGNLVVGPAGQVKITDFGIAHAAGSAPITGTGMLIGTPAYLAPERAAGEPASPASDLYSLGVVGYECLTGAPPFAGMPVEVAAAHQHRALPPLPATVPASAAHLVSELTAKDPASRPASAGVAAEQAAQIRESLTGGAASNLAAISTTPFPSGRVRTATLIDAHAGSWHEAYPVPRTAASLARRRGLLAAAGIVVAAALAGWLLVGALPTAPPPAAHPSHPAVPTVRTVQVNSSALVGQQVSSVSQTLRQLGLTPTVTWTTRAGQDTGTVVSVSPTGAVPVGSTVTVVAAFQQPGHHHDHGRGTGDSSN